MRNLTAVWPLRLRNVPRPFDELDARLIAEMRDRPRAAVLELARRLGVARGTVQARLGQLEARGVIAGHGPEVDPHALGYPILAFVSLDIAQGRLTEAVAVLQAIPEVLEVHAVSGLHDLQCRVVAHDPEHLQGVINRMVATPAVRRAISTIALSEQIAHRTGPLVEQSARRQS